MQLELPPLEPLSIVRLSACGWAEIDPDAPLAVWLQSYSSENKDAKYGDASWIHLKAGLWHLLGGLQAHMHIDLAADSVVSEQHRPSSTPSEILADVDKFAGVKLDVDLRCVIEIPRERLPKAGVVNSLLGISSRRTDARLDLTGARMAISELPPYREFYWQLKKDGTVKATIELDATQQVAPDYLTNLIGAAAAGFDKFIYEKRANDDGPTAPD